MTENRILYDNTSSNYTSDFCRGDCHVFIFYNSECPEGQVCMCGKKYYHYEKCPQCGNYHAVLVDTGSQNNDG